MKHKTKWLSGSGLLTILGVVCFATVVVAIVISNVLMWSNPVSAQAITLAGPVSADHGSGYSYLPSNPIIGNGYQFGVIANTSSDVPAWTLHISITGVPSGPSDMTMRYWNGTAYMTVALTGTTTLVGSIPEGPIAHGGSFTQGLTIMYNTTGTYTPSFWASI
jgi:hypothetical protein